MKKQIIYSALALSGLLMLAACNDDIDNYASRNNSEIQITPSSEYVKLDENTPDAVALTLDWQAAHDYGVDYITTYKYEIQMVGSSATNIVEYEDDGQFHREYTHSQLQEMLVGHFGQTTSTKSTVLFTVTAYSEGSRLIVPDIATQTVLIKTYGPKQFKADRLFVGGTAVGDDIELKATASDADVYTYTGKLLAGKINFPVSYDDEENAIGPAEADAPISTEEMPAVISDRAEANYWVIPEEDTYRITVNMRTQTVRIVAAGAMIEADQIFLAGSAVGDEQIEITPTLENEAVYAWRGELKAGNLYLPLTFEDAQVMSIVPKEAADHDIHDGTAHDFTPMQTTTTSSRYWTIPADGTYRIVVDTENKLITIYSPDTDPKNMEVSYNNTVDGINPYTQEVTELWMWGGFNSLARDADLKAGFQRKYTLQQSIANPYVFVYKGSTLPRESTADGNNGNKVAQGWVKFLVSSIENNVYAYGSRADAVRNSHSGYVSPALGQSETLVGGQANNRYAYFIIPEGANYVEVNIEKMTVIFDKR